MNAVWATVGVAALLAGCAPPPPLTISGSFDREEVAWSERPGRNAVTGFAVLRTLGGEARTCAGNEVGLVPDSTYARERLTALYSSTIQGSVPLASSGRLPPPPQPYLAATRVTRCDGQGNFTFENMPDGVWYVVVRVAWMAPGTPVVQGNNMFKRVDLRGGGTTKVVLP